MYVDVLIHIYCICIRSLDLANRYKSKLDLIMQIEN